VLRIQAGKIDSNDNMIDCNADKSIFVANDWLFSCATIGTKNVSGRNVLKVQT
jgi:hypothetical protein